MNDFQERLQELLEDNEINRSTLAKIVGVEPTTINGYFNKGYYPRMDILIKIASHFKCSLDYLLGLSDDKKIIYELSLDNYCVNFISNMVNVVKDSRISISKNMKELKMSEYNYYRWKNGRFPKTVNIISFAKHYDVSIDYLVGRSDKK